MFDCQRLFRTGLIVRDLAAAMGHYGRALNLTWAKPFTFDALPSWTPATGLRVELVSTALSPAFERWWGGAETLC
jgi:hypothetical protein